METHSSCVARSILVLVFSLLFMATPYADSKGSTTPSVNWLSNKSPEDHSQDHSETIGIGNGEIITVETISGKQLRGNLIFATDSVIVVWWSSNKYDPSLLRESAVFIHYSNLKKITFDKSNGFWHGAGYGGLVGFGVLAIAGALILFTNDRDILTDGEYYAVGGGGGFLTTSGAIVGSLVGGIIGSAVSDNETESISGNYEHYRSLLPRLLNNSKFESLTPELRTFLTESNDNLDSLPLNPSFVERTEPVSENAIYSEWSTILLYSSLSINYERAIAPYLSIRVGYGLGGSLRLDGGGNSGAGAMIMGVFLSKGTNKFEAGLGASVLNIKTHSGQYFDWWLYPAVSIGYRYHPIDAGVLVRLVLTYDYYYGTPLGLSIGYVF